MTERVRLLIYCLMFLLVPRGLLGQDDSDNPATYKLSEPSDHSRPFVVNYSMDVAGTLSERSPQNETKSFKLSSRATLKYTDRRLPPAGRNAAALRVLRHFDMHQTDVKVEDHKTELRLPPGNRLFIVEGRETELLYYPPEKLLSAQLLEQLRIPFDSVSAWGLLPKNSVKVGESWIPDTWAQQLVTNVEAVLKSEFNCTLKEVKGDVAFVELKGNLSGGRFGAETKLEFEGGYEFDLNRTFLRELHVTLKDKSTISPVSPGLDIVANIRFTRNVGEPHPALTDAVLAEIPLDPSPLRLLLHYDSPWGTRFLHTRDWHVIPGKFVILRLIEDGSLISQGTMMGLNKTTPGNHIGEEQFQADIRKSLGDRLRQIVGAEEIPTDDGRFLYRVIATGDSNGRNMQWMYYLCAHPDGRQVSFVFSTEVALLEELGNRDLALISTISWPDSKQPTTAD